jgi:ribose/xylose/arabinose/galactoside ABC-type transport system permease subunit
MSEVLVTPTPDAPAASPEPAEGVRHSRRLRIDGQNLALLALLGLLVLWFYSVNRLFLSWPNIMNIADAMAVIGLMAAGQTLVILAGGLDISVGASAAVCSVVAAVLMLHGWPVVLAVIAAVLTGLMLGGFNGFCVNVLRVNPVITTLGTLLLFKGLAFFIEPGQRPVGVRNATFQTLGTGRLLRSDGFPGIPVSFLFMLAVAVVVWVFLTTTDVGRYVYAVGGNERAARLSGISTKRITFMLYALSGALAGMGGLVIAARTGSANAEIANQGYELRAITAVFLGGAATTGGKGTMGGTLLAVLVIGVLSNGMNLIGINQFWQFIAQGSLLISAVAIGEWRKRRDEASKTVH